MTLEGNDSAFDVVDDPLLAPLRVGVQGPPVAFDVPVAVPELDVPDHVTVLPLVRFSDPALRAVAVSDMLYAGRVRDTSLEATVFSFDTEGGPRIGIYLLDGDLPITVATTAPEDAPGAGRATVGPPERNADVVFFGPVDRDVAVVVLEADGRPVAAVRPRARFALFNTLDVPRDVELHLVGYGSDGKVIDDGMIPPITPRQG